MAFKMKGNPMQRNFGIGKSPAKAQGIFKTLPDGAKKRIGKDEAKQMEEQHKKRHTKISLIKNLPMLLKET